MLISVVVPCYNEEKVIGMTYQALSDELESITDEYELIFLGFPIWYECAPNIINTFCKAYDWTGKSVALFATSGGSEMGETEAKLMPFMPGAKIVHTQVMPGGGEPKASKETRGNKGGKKHKHGKNNMLSFAVLSLGQLFSV